ncbi:MAG: hypothetical protein R6U93_00415 [Dehalococcoidia bacterium]
MYRTISWKELKKFLRKRVDKSRYVPGSYVCEDFARSLQADAKAADLDCHLVYVDFGSDGGHMCNAFDTKDKGLVYIDSTPPLEGNLTSCYTVVDVRMGEEYRPELIFPIRGYKKFLEPMGVVKNIDVV